MRSDAGPVECRKLTAEWKQPLLEFLSALERANEAQYFHPHAFTIDAMRRRFRAAREVSTWSLRKVRMFWATA